MRVVHGCVGMNLGLTSCNSVTNSIGCDSIIHCFRVAINLNPHWLHIDFVGISVTSRWLQFDFTFSPHWFNDDFDDFNLDHRWLHNDVVVTSLWMRWIQLNTVVNSYVLWFDFVLTSLNLKLTSKLWIWLHIDFILIAYFLEAFSRFIPVDFKKVRWWSFPTTIQIRKCVFVVHYYPNLAVFRSYHFMEVLILLYILIQFIFLQCCSNFCQFWSNTIAVSRGSPLTSQTDKPHFM